MVLAWLLFPRQVVVNSPFVAQSLDINTYYWYDLGTVDLNRDMNTNNGLQYFGKDLEAMSFAKNYHKWILNEFNPYLGNLVGEIGAGTGNFSNFIVTAGINRLFAFEPSENMYPLLENQFRENDKVETINAFFEKRADDYVDFFDSLLYVNVLEHIENNKKELSNAYRTIREKGYILIFVPALSWLYGELDNKVGHFRRYHKQELIELVKCVGFSIEKVKYFDIAGIIPWYIAFVLLKKITTETNVSLYDRLVVPVMRIIEREITPPIGKNLLLIGQKA